MSEGNLYPTPPPAPSVMAELPQEVVVEILLRLPVESMMRFKSVCKSWYALFRNPSFVARHLANQSKDHHIFLQRNCLNTESAVTCILTAIGDGDNDEGVSSFSVANVEYPPTMKEYGGALVGHCDGLIALSDFSGQQVFVCNLATRDFRTLPESTFHPFPKNWGDNDDTDSLHSEISALGFGYDRNTNDYKVVRIVDFWPDYERLVELPSRAEVFSIGTDSSWREIPNADVGAYCCGCEHMEHYLDGICYWWGAKLFGEYVLLSFNMATEVFEMVPLPDFCNPSIIDGDNTANIINIGVYNNESIALFVQPFEACFEKCIDVWVMKEFGVKESWTNLLTMGPLPGLGWPLAFWKNDKALFYEDPKGQLVFCDLVTLKSKTFPFYGSPLCSAAITYIKTLVSINKREDIVA